MGAQDSLYSRLEEKYYDFLDSLDKAGIPVYSVVDAVEGANIPTFPIAAILLLLIIAGMGFLAFSFLMPVQSNLVVSVVDGAGANVSNAQVTIELEGGEELNGITDNSGEALFAVPRSSEVNIIVSKSPDFEEKSESFIPAGADETKVITLQRKVTTVAKTINLFQQGTVNQHILKEINVDFRCSSATFSETSTSDEDQTDRSTVHLAVRTSDGSTCGGCSRQA